MRVNQIDLKILQNAINRYNNGEETRSIAKSIGISPINLVNFLKKRKEVLWRGKKKIPVDETFFEKIDSEEKAYILGFICADGYNSLYKYGRYLQIELQKGDLEILEKIANCMRYSGKIRIRKHKTPSGKINSYYLLRIHSKKISQDLLKIGISNNKSKDLRYPNWLDKNLIRHFLRGYFDGDGCFSLPRENISNVSLAFIGTRDMCEKISEFLINTCGINSKLKEIPGAYKCTIYGNSQSEKVLNFMYGDSSIYLSRKYNKYLDFKNIRKECYKGMSRKLNKKQVVEIRKRIASGETFRSIAKDFGVSHGPILKIKLNENYNDY